MKNTIQILILLLAISIANRTELLAQDSLIVKTLTFEDITKRRGLWDFPDSNESFRKILMLFTLKCDPRTTQDVYACGEWDYLNYSVVYVPTGKKDSTAYRYPLYRLGSQSPDSIFYTTDTTFTTYQKYRKFTILDNSVNETEYKFENGTKEFSLNSKIHHFQFILEKSKMIAAGMKSGELNKLKFFVSSFGDTYKNLTIKLRNIGQISSTDFTTDNLTTVYNYTKTFTQTGWNEIFFDSPFRWQKLLNLLVDVSYEKDDSSNPSILVGQDTLSGVQISDEDYYLEFDGTNDYISSGNIPELNGVSKFTYETWFRVKSWKPWAKLMGKGNKFHIELGGTQGDIYLIVRNPDNTYGMAASVIPLNTWVHIAMVYDGTQSENKDKLKLFLNGDQYNLSYNGAIPPVTVSNDEPFTLTELYHATSDLNGAMIDSRVWLSALDGSTITEWKNKKLNSSHPNYNSLLVYYPMNEGKDLILHDKSGKNNNGTFIGTPEWKKYQSDELTFNPQPLNFLPNICLLSGTYTSHPDSVLLSGKIPNPPVSIQKYEIYNYAPRIKELTYGWSNGWTYTYSSTGSKIDSLFVPYKKVIKNDTLKYYGKPFDVTNAFEIGRYITPYGKGLDLGPNGFTWIYDVTDYRSLLTGSVDLEAGAQSELIDLKFLFIKGIPPRKVLKLDNLWENGIMEKSYASLSDNTQLKEITVPLLTGAKQLMVKTRLTGHGHNSNDGNYPHCCEWKDNTHYLFVNKQKAAEWHVWQERDCASNPVFPQGGTWPGSREGWCPGDLVKDNDFELTNLMTGNSMSFDYDITKVPDNNKGMGGGIYRMIFQLFQYSAPTHQNDVEIYDVITPNNFPGYSRKNPLCADPVIIVRNNGSEPVTSLDIEYGVSGGIPKTYHWTGALAPNVKQEISVPVPNNGFWLGDSKRTFTAKVSMPNGKPDDYLVNDAFSTNFNLPDFLTDKLVLRYVTNLRPQYYTYRIMNLHNQVVFEKNNLAPQSINLDTLSLPHGCYTLQLLDDANMGLSYWAYPEQGSGSLGIYDLSGTLLKAFNPDFGYIINYSFVLGDLNFVQDRNIDYLITVAPNPAKNVITLNSSYDLGNSELTIIDESGKEYFRLYENLLTFANEKIDIQNLPSGVFFLNVKAKGTVLVRKFVKAE